MNLPFRCRLPALLMVAPCFIGGCFNSVPIESRENRELTFGQRQVEQMLADRPGMRKSMSLDQPIVQWIASGFEGDRIGTRVYWCANTPPNGAASAFSPPYEGYPPFMLVSAGPEVTPIDKWASLVYEFHNMDSSVHFLALHSAATKGEISGHEYAEGCVKLEFEALQETAEFIRQKPLPASKHGRDDFVKSLEDVPSDYTEYKRLYEASGVSVGNYDYFLQEYTRSIAPWVKTGSPKDIDEEVERKKDSDGQPDPAS